MGSDLFAEVRRAGRAEGEAVGLAKGELAAARSLCAAFAKQHHAATWPQVAAVIRGCRDTNILRQWALAAPRVSDARFVRLVQRPAPVAASGPLKAAPARTRRVRVARPSRRAKATRRR